MGMLDGKTAIVTGGGRGIGRGVSQALAKAGAKVCVADLGVDVDGTGKSNEPAEETVRLIQDAGGEAYASMTDVVSHSDAEALVGGVLEKWGKLDIVVTPAGILRDRMVFNMTEEEWDAVIDVHAKGTFNVGKFAAIHWRQRREYGRLITFTSGSGLFGAAGQPNYAAAKMAIVGFTLSCANALNRYGVTANSIAPGASTRMTATIPGDDPTKDPSMKPENVAPIVVYLASEDAGWCNGRVIRAWGHQVGVYNNHYAASTIFNDKPWDVATLGARMKQVFEPIVSGRGDELT
jgi:NAD(P)-dependent dehydrogenase (short-subunit alcohol dehydrogenase family)